MTRKRINQSSDGSNHTPERRNLQHHLDARHPKRSNTDSEGSFANYGYQDSEYGSSRATNEKRTFPRKGNYQSSNDIQEYTSNYDREYTSQNDQYAAAKAESEYPKEVVTYLRNMNRIATETALDDLAIEKCIEEVKGYEEALLKYPESAGVVEKLFGSNSRASLEFLKLITKLKHKTMIDMMFSGCGSKTLETLLYAAIKDRSSDDLIQVLNVFVEICCENWGRLAFAQKSCFIIRSLLRISAGFIQEPVKPVAKEEPKEDIKDTEMEKLSRHNYAAITQLVFDFKFFQDATEMFCSSSLFQDAIRCEASKSSARIDALIDKAITTSQNDPDILLESLKSQVGSGMWEQLAKSCSEDARLRLWMSVFGPNVSTLVDNQYANFPLQKLIASVKSVELATDVFDELSGHLTQLFTSKQFGIVLALITCISKFDDLQNSFLKVLRKYFNANKESNRLHFLFNVLSMNGCEPKKFNASSVVPRGSLLGESLLNLTRTKTIRECLKAMPKETLFALSIHHVASHFIEAVFSTRNLDRETKLHVASSYEGKWPLLIDNSYGSHVFERLWDSEAFPVDLKANFLTQIKMNMPRDTGKFWKFMLHRTQYHLFHTKKGAWFDQWKQKGEMTERKKKHMEKIKQKAEKKKVKKEAAEPTRG